VAFSSCMHFLTMSRVLDSGDKYRGTPPTANAQTGANQATRRYPAEGTRIASVGALSTSMRVNPDSPTLTDASEPRHGVRRRIPHRFLTGSKRTPSAVSGYCVVAAIGCSDGAMAVRLLPHDPRATTVGLVFMSLQGIGGDDPCPPSSPVWRLLGSPRSPSSNSTRRTCHVRMRNPSFDANC